MLKEGRILIDDVPVLGIKYLIPFKAKAYLDLVSRINSGEHVDSRDIRKHKNDVFRLLLMLADNELGVTLPEAVRIDIEQFTGMMNDEIVDVKALGGGLIDKESLLTRLKMIYHIPE